MLKKAITNKGKEEIHIWIKSIFDYACDLNLNLT